MDRKIPIFLALAILVLERTFTTGSFFEWILFGYLALKTESILPGFLIHFLGSAGFDVMCL